MATQRLTERFIERISVPGQFGDGGRGSHGLSLRVKTRKGGGLRKHFVQRVTIAGTKTRIGVGSWPTTTLAKAREKVIDNLRLIERGGDPRRGKVAPISPATPITRMVEVEPVGPTFKQAAERTIAIYSKTWTGTRTRKQWESSLNNYVLPKIGRMPVTAIGSPDVHAVLAPVWSSNRPTAKKIAQRMSKVFDWSISQGLRKDDPVTVALKGLPKNGTKPVEHRAFTHHSRIAEVLRKVREGSEPESVKLAIEMVLLTATRVSEVTGAKWHEIDLEAKTWTVPLERSKTRNSNPEPHVVPLSPQALDVLLRAREANPESALVFPSIKGKVLHNSTVLRGYKKADPNAVTHGARSSFRVWAAESAVSSEVAEAVLNHKPKGIIASYQRSNLINLRAVVMDDWARAITPA